MKILVTGGAGFIGSHLCEALLARGEQVTALDNFDPFYDQRMKRTNLSECLANPLFTLVEGDIRNMEQVGEVFADGDFDMIVHLAARAGVRPSIEDPLAYQDVNGRGTMVLLEAAKQFEVKKFIFASSSSVYGNAKKVPFSELDSVDFPISPYAATKKACELICHTYSHLCDIDLTCLRFFTVYGPRQRPDLAIYKFTELIEAGEPIPVFGDGSSRRDYTYIDDIIQGVLAAMDRCQGYHIYNLGHSQPIVLAELIERLEAVLGRKAKIDRQPAQPGDVECTYADVSRAWAELGYEPVTDIQDGLRRFVEWFRQTRIALK